MGLFKRLAGLLGLAKDEDHHNRNITPSSSLPDAVEETAPPHFRQRQGFSVPVKVKVDREPPPPLLVFCPAGDGGLQGLRWYTRRLRIDEDGDIADEFLDEISPGMSLPSMEKHDTLLPRFKAKYDTSPAKVKNLVLLPNGKIQHLVEYQGRLEWL